KWAEATRETDEGVTTYYVVGKNARGREVEVSVTPEGQLIEVATEVTMAEVPKAVLSGLKTKLPKFKAEYAAEVRRDGKVVEYSFEGTQGKEEIEVTVSADGKTVEIED